MRLKISFYLSGEHPEVRPNKHAVQGFIYDMLKGTPYGERHDEPRFKFFTFSDFFRDREGRFNLLISSPDSEFIKTLSKKLHGHKRVYIGKNELRITKSPCSVSSIIISFGNSSKLRIHEMGRLT